MASKIKYVKMSHIDHIKEIPDTYVGSIESTEEEMYIFTENNIIEKKKINYIPALYKLFDEILVNARDNICNDKTCNQIDVECNIEEGYICVKNNGDIGIPIEKHELDSNVLIPSMIFGELLTSSNYDKNEDKITGGKNGYGAKVINIFSTRFIVEIYDFIRKKHFIQEWTDNMSKTDGPIVDKAKEKSSVKVKFYPDFKRFNINGLNEDYLKLFYRRTIDIAGISDGKLKITYNNEKININNFKSYIELYYKDETIYFDSNERWSVGVIYKRESNNEIISFVNGINTYKGGTHCNYVIDSIIKILINDYIKKKDKNIKINATILKDNLIFFINSVIVNPSFSSQTKDTLTTKSDKFGSKYEPSQVFLKKLAKCGIVEHVIDLAKSKENASLKKTDGKKQIRIAGIPKLEDANKAGTKDSKNCTLILTEGDSAKTTAMAGLTNIGRDYYGVFPLKGKLLNVREATNSQLLNNEEIKNLKTIIGLKQGEDYSDINKFNSLRYGHIIIFVDSDSVTSDTPLLLKNSNNLLEIRTIDNISNDWINFNDKEISFTSFKIWTEKGWTEIKKVIRHKVNKKMYRVLTHTGCVDVTEDHSLIKNNGCEISPKDCIIGDELLHNFPNFHEEYYNIDEIKQNISMKLCNQNINISTDFNITEKESYVMGLFWADGSCNINKWQCRRKPVNRPNIYTFNRTSYLWSICNTNLDNLNKSKEYLETVYDYDFKIITCKMNSSFASKNQYIYKLIIKGGIMTKPIIDKYRSLFYDENANKKIPLEILNSPNIIKEQFFRGYYDGDSSKGNKTFDEITEYSFDLNSKIGAHGLFLLCKSIGYNVSININQNKSNVYSLIASKGKQQTNPIAIKKIIELGNTEQYVYDLETENHHFQAGIGSLIIHNTDGSHIKGLFMNLIHSLWPSLIKKDGFIQGLSTPIIKAFHKTKKDNVLQFFTIHDYEKWKNDSEINTDKYNIKYYKGLGTSTATEAKEYFEDIDKKIIDYKYENYKSNIESNENQDIIIDSLNDSKSDTDSVEEEEQNELDTNYIPIKDDDDALRLAFVKNRANERKKWLINYNKNNIIKYEQKKISYFDFIHNELIHFSNEDVYRSIPNLIDGLKPSQRKVLYGCFKADLDKDEKKVSQLAGIVSDISQYHHGEMSLNGTIIGMAQNYVGTNNINILEPNGQFGSRYLNGKDHASSRYIWTKLSPMANLIYKKLDNPILNQLYDDGLPIEPEFYVPIIPMILVNGTEGIGTGFSTKIPPYNPVNIIDNLINMINNDELNDMDPWWQSFDGKINKISNNSYEIKGNYTIKGNKLIITELPVGESTYNYKEFLEKMVSGTVNNKKKEVKKENHLLSYIDNNTDTKIYFELTFEENYLDEIENLILEKMYKLSKKYSITNMHLYSSKGCIKKYNDVKEIIAEYYNVRLEYYNKRKEYQLNILKNELENISYKVKFIVLVINNKLIVNNTKKNIIELELEKLEFPKLGNSKTYDYLLSMPIYNLTYEKIEELKKLEEKKQTEYDELENLNSKQIWKNELLELKEKYIKWYNEKLLIDNNQKSNLKKSKKK